MSSVSHTAHQSFIVVSTVLWGVYRSVGLDRVTRLLVADHTRDAAFQLFCDLRTNTPKNWAFAKRHARALTPRTVIGWLAMLTTLLSLASYTAVIGAILLGVTVAAINMLTVLSVFVGITLACVLACFSAMLLLGSCVVGCSAIGCAMAYTSLASTKFVLQSTHRLLLGGPTTPEQQEGGEGAAALPEGQSSTADDTDAAGQEGKEAARQDLAAAAAAAGGKAAEGIHKTLAALPGSSSRAAEIAMARLGVTLPPADGSSDDGSVENDHRAPPLPSAAAARSETDAVESPGSPPREQELPPSTFHQTKGFAPSSFFSPKKRRTADTVAAGSSAGATNSVTGGSDTSESSQAPDLLGMMNDGFIGSPPRNNTPALSRTSTADVSTA